MKSTILSFVLVLALLAPNAFACPKQGPIPDYNCDQTLRVVVIGDSLVYGIGDTQNGNKGGYVLRTTKKLPQITFTNLGVPGLHAKKLVADVTGNTKTASAKKIWAAVEEADVVVLDVGRNDSWDLKPALNTYNDLRRISTTIEKHVKQKKGAAPIVVTAVLMIPNRGAQSPWIKELNQLIMDNSRANRPGDLHFDQVSKRLLSADQIHPTPQGYQSMSDVFVSYIKGTLAKRMKKLRPDKDHDGIYDLFETLRFHTDPKVADTDGDGVLDGEQIFGS